MSKKHPKAFVAKQKKKLKKEMEKIISQITELKKSDPFLDPGHVSDNAAVDTDAREQIGHETVQAQLKNLQHKLVNINDALERIKRGTYGICKSTHKLISQQRLELIPEASYCIEAEKRLRK